MIAASSVVRVATAQSADNWIGTGATGTWSDASNWSTGTVPTSSIDTFFNLNSIYGVAVNSQATANSITVTSGDPTFNINQGTVTLAGAFTVDTSAGITIAVGLANISSGSLNDFGNLTLNATRYTASDSISIGTGTMTNGQSGAPALANGILSLNRSYLIAKNAVTIGGYGGTATASLTSTDLNAGLLQVGIAGGSGTLTFNGQVYGSVENATQIGLNSGHGAVTISGGQLANTTTMDVGVCNGRQHRRRNFSGHVDCQRRHSDHR